MFTFKVHYFKRSMKNHIGYLCNHVTVTKNKCISTSCCVNHKYSRISKHHVYYELESNYFPREHISQFIEEINERKLSNIGQVILHTTF